MFEPGSTLNLSEETLITLAPNAKLDVQGDVMVQTQASTLITSSGRFSWSSGSSLTSLPLSSLKLEQSISGSCVIRGEVAWLGAGSMELHGGNLKLTHNSELNAAVNLVLENTNIETEGAEAGFNTSGNVKAQHVQVDGLSWTHDGSSALHTSRVRLLNSQWSNSDGWIEHAKVFMWGNHFDESHVTVTQAQPFSHFVQNEWSAPWNDTRPCLHLLNAEDVATLRENHWRGGVGFHATGSAFRALCNVWELCSEAVILEGIAEGCFSSSCGGGGNSWTSNDVHVSFMEAALPSLSASNNQFGHAFEWFAKGVTTSDASEWNIHGANWDASSLQVATLSSSNLNTDVRRWTDAGYVQVPCHATDNIEMMTCEEYRRSRPQKKKKATLEITNVLGQEIQHQWIEEGRLTPVFNAKE